jgi:sugar (pentulose or hexulose) kinase
VSFTPDMERTHAYNEQRLRYRASYARLQESFST